MGKKKKTLTKHRKLILIAIALILILLIVISIMHQAKQNAIIQSGGYISIKQIIEKFNCKYIKSRNSSLQDITKDIYVEFDKGLYTGTKSNEQFFINITRRSCKVFRI